MVKAILDLLIELKDGKSIINNSKQILIKENNVPSKTHIMW